ncbi:DNA-binding transcriptional MerR regulator [Pullulanibacillus pueri]|uniref:Sin domain-containing protein n=1 Tax=Pullulanibacillus pueri TaxID=1437324 RepID=A0A8J2ZUK1_9BACL|nr:anti-repressor SinI family protein [Pullulanibacillus pueri]MBM7680835.1 DNA-binding transcriptional MerR regulator [Pullulanibacillus pueri]GGH78518.1 hypothetical protein GCM10007096_12070 [Pullulanibacillus pueri]
MHKLPVDTRIDCRTLDAEWVDLILDAKELGLTIDEIRTFLTFRSPHTLKRIENQKSTYLSE